MRKVSAIGVAVVLGLILIFFKGAPQHYDPGSAAQSNLRIVGNLISAPPAEYAIASQQPQPEQLKDAFNLELYHLKSQADVVERALSLNRTAYEVVEHARQENSSSVQVNDILTAQDSFAKVLDAKQLTTIEKLEQTKEKLLQFLQSFKAQMAGATTTEKASEILTGFELQAREYSVDDVNNSSLRLESALNAAARAYVGDTLRISTYGTVRLLEGEGTLERDVFIGLTTGKIPLESIDASELMNQGVAGTGTPRLSVIFGNAPAESGTEPTDSRQVLIPRGVTKIVLLRRTIVPAGLTRLPGPRWFPFRYFRIQWPEVYPVKIRLRLDLSQYNLTATYPYTIISNTPDRVGLESAITKVSLPADSLFNSNIRFKTPLREGDEDVRTPDELITPAYFLTHNSIWIESSRALVIGMLEAKPLTMKFNWKQQHASDPPCRLADFYPQGFRESRAYES